MTSEAEIIQKTILESDEKVEIRRKKVWSLLLQGFTQQQIAEKFDLSLKTISRDIQELKKESAEWMESLPKGQIQMYHKSNFEIIDKVTKELWNLYEKTEDEKLKLKILNTIAEKRKLYANLLDSKNLLHVRDSIHSELAPKPVFTDIFNNERSKIDFKKMLE